MKGEEVQVGVESERREKEKEGAKSSRSKRSLEKSQTINPDRFS